MAYSETRFVTRPDRRLAYGVSGIAVAALLAVGYLTVAAPFAPPLAASSVKVQLDNGHGSGVHIGNGLVLTGAHVVGDTESVQLKLTDGTTRDAEVVWTKPESDVALLQTAPDGLAASPINCAPPLIGEAVTVTGNPEFMEFITTRGYIAGTAAQVQDWVTVATVDMTILPGMSGGGAINDRGEVVGIAIAFLSIPLGFAASATGLGMIVPSDHICALLGRT